MGGNLGAGSVRSASRWRGKVAACVLSGDGAGAGLAGLLG